MKFAALAAPALLLAACTPAPPEPPPPGPSSRPQPVMPHSDVPVGLRFTVEPRIVAPGATVTLVLHNGTAHQVGYNLCNSGLEQLQSGAWGSIPQDGVCTQELRVVAPGQQARYQRTLPNGLAAGEYRFRTGVEAPLNRGTPGLHQIYSETLRVRR